MVQSNSRVGDVLKRGLLKAKMMNIAAYGLTATDLMQILYGCVLEVARIHFDTDKEDWYDVRYPIGSTNAKRADEGGVYDSSTRRLTITMSPIAAAEDVGKGISFFDLGTGNGFSATISGFVAPNIYEIALWFNVPSMDNVGHVTVLDWYSNRHGNMVLTEHNQLFSPENLVIFDVSNSKAIDVVTPDEFERRKSQPDYSSSDQRWAMCRKSAIEFAAGTGAPVMGMLQVTGFFLPPTISYFESFIPLSDVRIGELEQRFLLGLLEIKHGQPIEKPGVMQAEMGTYQLKDRDNIKSIQTVR